MKKCSRLISHLAFPIHYSIISINCPTTNSYIISINMVIKLLSLNDILVKCGIEWNVNATDFATKKSFNSAYG